MCLDRPLFLGKLSLIILIGFSLLKRSYRGLIFSFPDVCSTSWACRDLSQELSSSPILLCSSFCTLPPLLPLHSLGLNTILQKGPKLQDVVHRSALTAKTAWPNKLNFFAASSSGWSRSSPLFVASQWRWHLEPSGISYGENRDPPSSCHPWGLSPRPS